jgi:hypothetical protein
MQPLRIHFLARDLTSRWPDIDALDEEAIARHASRFRGGVNNWIVQTYLRLKAPLAEHGIEATLGEALVPDSVVIAHRDCINGLFSAYHRSYVVGIRADRAPVRVGEWEVVQNPLAASGTRVRYLPFWPQPGLIPRRAQRSNRLEDIAYFGRTASLPHWVHAAAFRSALRDLGVELRIHEQNWFDYSEVDAVIAHRREAPTMLLQKPASKLINAWLAGVPALLADEPAYLALRRSPLDFASIDSPESVLRELAVLKRHPDRYRAMVENGLRRSASTAWKRSRRAGCASF